jgi:DNA-directed RNA polymerase specialized sigma24 family protein
MLMKTRIDPVDFHAVDQIHEVIHKRLENWARYVHVHGARWQASIWRMGKSNGRQWHPPELRPDVDTLDGHRLEKAIADLPQKHREAIRWSYYYKDSPARKARELAVSYEGLMTLVRNGRSMLKNTA